MLIVMGKTCIYFETIYYLCLFYESEFKLSTTNSMYKFESEFEPKNRTFYVTVTMEISISGLLL